MAEDLSKMVSLRLDHDEVHRINKHLERLRAKAHGIPFSFTDALRHLITNSLDLEEAAARKKSA